MPQAAIVSAQQVSGDRRSHDPDYEEVTPVTVNLRHTPDGRGDGKHCEVCGSAQADVRCQSCSGQVFCAACDEVFHKHPRRTQHKRMVMEGVRPPLPPKNNDGGQPPPQPPPRRNKRSFLGGGGFSRKDQHLTGSLVCLHPPPIESPSPFVKPPLHPTSPASFPSHLYAKPTRRIGGIPPAAPPPATIEDSGGPGSRTIMGSLKRFMGSRPLPPPPGGAAVRGDTNVHSNLIRSVTSPNLADDRMDASLALSIPQTVVDLSNIDGGRKPPAPPTPAPQTAPPTMGGPQYPGLMPRPSSAAGGEQQSAGPHRKLSLQQMPVLDNRRQSMVEMPPGQSARNRSQSVSDEQWSRLLASKGHPPQPPPPHLQDNSATNRGRFGASAASVGGVDNMGSGRGGGLARGVTSSASVCDLNMIAQQPLHQHQKQQQQMMPHMGGMQQSGSFQQLNMVPYTGGMLWPAPCDMCHQHPMYHPSMPGHLMKRAASNISVNMSSASSDITGYPWQPHMHHHMPPPQVMYPGYYPPPPHILANSMQGSSISIPESMAAFSKVSSSPAPSIRSSSRRSHKSNKSRSFSTADLSRRGRSQHRSDSTDSTTSTPSLEDDFHSSNKTRFPGIPLAWQCDHCTFINQAGSRVCGMCSKFQAASSGGQQQRNGRRSGERRRSDQHEQPQLRRYQSNRRNEQDEDDRDGSDYDNDGKHNNGVHRSSRDNRTDKNGKSSSASRSKKKWKKRGGSSGSASDAVDELEKQFSDIKMSKTRGTEYEGLSSRLREREKDRDRERGSRRREGLSGRYKSHNMNTSDRPRTPGRQSPDTPQESPSGSPRDESPQDDEVFGAIDSQEKRTDTNSNSNEGTLVDPSHRNNSDETILVTEYRRARPESRVRRTKSTISSRASTPGPAVEVHHADVQMLPAVEIMELAKPLESKQLDHIDLQKPKEKSTSPFRENSQHDVEEQSFANTLDDVATMGTNEVADIDLNLDDRPLSALPINFDEIQQFIPTLQYVEPLSQNQEVKETALISEHEDCLVEKANSISVKVEISEIQVSPAVVIESNAHDENNAEHANVEQFEEESDALNENTSAVDEGEIAVDEEEIEYIDEDVHETEVNRALEVVYTDEDFIEARSEYTEDSRAVVEGTNADTDGEGQQRLPNRGSLEDFLQRGSTAGVPERQFTPLSFSSSDAAFYSPADSPDESADEKFRDKPSGSLTQTVVQAAPEEELVTALESLHSIASLRSSRETIRSSVEELPYYTDQVTDQEEIMSGRTPASASSPHTATGTQRAATPEAGGYLSSDAYEGLSFQDAVSGNSELYGLYRSASEQMLPKNKAEISANQKAQSTASSATSGERYLTVDQLIARRKQETMRREGLELVHVLREAEKAGFQAEEVSVALPLCGERGPLEWLADNWRHMVDTVRTLASSYGREKEQNNVGDISEQEARAALRAQRGNIWAAVTESVEQRQNKFAELCSKGNFPPEAVADALQRHDGDADAAFRDLSTKESLSEDIQIKSGHPIGLQDTQQRAEPPQFVTSPLYRDEDEHSQLYANISLSGAKLLKKGSSGDDMSIYSNVASTTNPLLVAKTEALLHELEEEAPMLSRDLKLKIVKAILEEDHGSSVAELRQKDSDEESTIEELLAREKNPTFYEYFTAVDLDEEEEESHEEEDAEDGTSNADSEPASESFFEAVAAPRSGGDAEVRAASEMLYVSKEDVVVHNLKADAHYADLSASNYSDAEEYMVSGFTEEDEDHVAQDEDLSCNAEKESSSDIETRRGKVVNVVAVGDSHKSFVQPVAPAAPTAEVSDQEPTSGRPVTVQDRVNNTVVVLRQKKPQAPLPLSKTSVTGKQHQIGAVDIPAEKKLQIGEEEDGEQGSVSVTTGRLSLTLSHNSDQDGGGIDVTASAVQRDEVQAQLATKDMSLTGPRALLTEDHADNSRESDISHIAELEAQESVARGDQTATLLEEHSALPHTAQTCNRAGVEGIPTVTVTIPGPRAGTNTSYVEAAAPEPAPVKKASSIIGKAIAKAMARESSARDSTRESNVYSPEPDDSSRGSTPASLTQESTAASSLILESGESTPISTTPQSNTPRSTPDITEETPTALQGTADSEEDDLLRSLDTIPEEEEGSERTESGRLLSRSSSRNIKLPFSATSIVSLGPLMLLKTDKHRTPPMEPTPTIDYPAMGMGSVTSFGNTALTEPSAASTAPSVDSEDQYQDSRLSERSDERPEDDSDSSTPQQVEDLEGEDSSLALIPTPAIDSLPYDVKPQLKQPEEEASASSNVTHGYYNTRGRVPAGHLSYYNEMAATKAAPLPPPPPPPPPAVVFKIDQHDYESMYSIKRDIDQLRESSSEVAEKINSMGTGIHYKGPLKDTDPSKEVVKSNNLKHSESHSTTDERRKEASNSSTSTMSSSSTSAPLTGAQMLAEENVNTLKRSPKSSSLARSSTAPAVITELERDAPASKDEMQQMSKNRTESSAPAPSAKQKVAKTKQQQTTKKPESQYSSSDQTDGSRSSNSYPPTVVQNTAVKYSVKPVNSVGTVSDKQQVSTVTRVSGTAVAVKSTAASEVHNANDGAATVKPPKVVPTPSVVKKGELRPAGGGPSAFSSPSSSLKKEMIRNKTGLDSSGESEDEDKIVAAQRLEGLKGREPDYQEVQELKQQITELKKSLQEQMSEGESSATSPLAKTRDQGGKSTTRGKAASAVDEGEATAASGKAATEEDNVPYEQLRFDRTVRRLLAEGQAGSYEQAELAAHLLSLSFDEEDSVAAAQECSSIYGALHFLQQDCELCAEKYPMRNMVSMLNCTHRCCMECAKTYFTYQIKTKNIREMRCPFCNEPNLDTAEETMAEYFNHLDILLKGIVDEETHELFQRKLRDLTLMSDPNFRWCNKCSSGFIANPRARKLICPDCRDVTCAHCRLPWEVQHEGISCDAFSKWKHENDPEAQAQGVAKHLAENGITCPKCKFQYSLAKGGCMHFTCMECKYEFCSGCGQPFRQGARCPVGPYCERLGLHAHHPRNCLFYLRDKEPQQLQQLLKENNVSFDSEPQGGEGGNGETSRRHCQVPEQKETPEGLVDDICGRSVLQGSAGLCRLHYVEYLVEKINSHRLDPVIIFDEADLRVCLRRNGKTVPIRRWESEKLYRDKLIKLIKEQLPL